MEHCVYTGSQDFKNLLSQYTNINPIELAAKVSIWQDNNGLDSFPTKEDLDKYDNNINKDVRTSTHPILTSNQVIDITSALVFAGLNNISELSLVEDNIRFETIEKELIKKLRSLRDDTSMSNNDKIELVNRYKFILNSEYKLYDFWKTKVKDYIDAQFKLNIKSSNFEEEGDLEEDSDGNNKVVEKDSYLESKHVKATANIKYLISTIPDIKEFKDGITIYNKEGFLGLPRFKNPSQMWVTINTILNNVVQIKENGSIQDGYNLMMIELQKNVEYKPELSWLISKVDKMTDSVKSQFFKTFCLHRSNYLDHVIDTKGGSPISKFTDSNVESKQKHILDSWASEFMNNFGIYDNSGNIKFNTEKINDLRNLIMEYNGSFRDDFINKNLSNKTTKLLNDIFKSIGVNLHPNVINKLISKYNTNNTLLNLRTFNVDLFNNLKMFQDIKEGTLLTRSNNIIYFNSRFFKELADEESYFSNIVGEDSFIGPDGNRIYIIDNNNTFSLKIKEWKSGDTEYLSDLKNTNYSSESIWVNDMLNPDEDESLINKLTLVSYGKFSKRSDNLDLGDKASDLKPSDTFIDQFNKQLGGYFIGLAEADKTKQYYIKGPDLIEATMMMAGDNVMFANINNEVNNIFTGYLSAELKRIYAAYEAVFGENKIKDSDKILYYHHDGKGNPGNAFHSFLLPNLNLEEYGLATFDEANNVMRILPDKMNKESLLANQKLQKYISDAILKNIQSDINYAIETGLIKQSTQQINGKETRVLTNNAISLNFLKAQGYNGNGTSINGDNYAILSLISKYTINSMIGNIEQTMIFNGDPALYKVKYSKEEIEIDGEKRQVLKAWNQQEIFSDFMKRIPAVSANGKISRIYKDNQGNPVVREYYNSVVLENVEVGSSFFGIKNDKEEVIFNETNIDLIVKATYKESEGKSIDQYKEDIKKLFKPYLSINQTDAQAWITLDTYRERMLSWGEWTPNHENSYKKIKNNELLSLEDKMLLAQPLKTVHVEYKKHIPGVMNMHYNKQSEAVLLPYLTKGTKLDNLRVAMENQGIDHAIVLDGKKVGATVVTNILDENGVIKNHSDIKFTPTKLSYRGLFLQQELPPHGLGNRQVGIQGVKNVMAVVEKTEEGRKTIDEYHETISKLSNIGLIALKEEMGYRDDLGFIIEENGSSKLYNTIYKEFYSELSSNHLDAIKGQYPLDAFPIKDKLQNKLNAFVTKKAVKLEQLGGAFIQMSDLGLIGTEISLKDPVGNGIIFFKDPGERLKPMNITEDGVKPAQILLPYNKIFDDPKFGRMLEKKFGTTNYRELTAEQIKSVFDKKVLEGFSYRIPNQGPSSNDAFEIVGILPPSIGDTMIMFSDITTKTGSDFDIDKAFIILPNYYYDKDHDTIRRIAYDKDHETKEGLENHRLDLMRKMLLNPMAYIDVMSPLDDPWLEKYAKKYYPEVKARDDLQFFRGTFQASIKSTFDNAKSLVGVIANHMSNQSLFLHENIGFNGYYLGKGISTITKKQKKLPEPSFTFEDDFAAWDAIDDLDSKTPPIPTGTIIRLLNTSREFTKDKISSTGLYKVIYVKDEIMDLIPINENNLNNEKIKLSEKDWNIIIKKDNSMTKEIWNTLSFEEQNKILECL